MEKAMQPIVAPRMEAAQRDLKRKAPRPASRDALKISIQNDFIAPKASRQSLGGDRVIIMHSVTIDVRAHRWGRTYDAGELDRRAAEALRQARAGDCVRLMVGDFLPAPVPQSLYWARPELVYTIDASTAEVGRAWREALAEAEVVNHG